MNADALRDQIEAWNGQSVLVSHDEPSGTWIFIALHDLTLGPAVGGTRMKVYPEIEDGLRDATRLAEGMTYKWASIDLPFGGGKAVLAIPRPFEGEERTALLRRYGRILRSLGGMYSTGVDMGVTPEDMQIVAEEAPGSVKGASSDSSTDPGPFTALGVLVGIRATLRAALGSDQIAGRTFLVQGVGDVGLPLARMLAEAGGTLLISDIDADAAARVAEELGGSVVSAEQTYEAECDVFVPCAIGGILNEETIPSLRCRAIAGSANNQLGTLEDGERLHERGILYAPDYIVNGGGAIAFGRMSLGESDHDLLRDEVRTIETSLDEIFAEAAEAAESPLHAAIRHAHRALNRGRGAGG